MDAGRGQIRSDTRVRTLDGGPLRGETRLPRLDGVDAVEDPKLDVLGRLVSGHKLLVAGAGGAGLLLGSALPSGAFRRAGGGLLGAAVGAVAALGVVRASELASGRGDPESTAFVRDVAGAGTSPRRGEAGEQLRVLNWNVRELIGNDGIVRTDDDGLDAIVEVVAREHPDVLVLQEVSQGSVLSEMSDNLDELVRRTGATDAVLVPNGMRASGKAKGQAVLTFGDARIQDARGLRHEDPLGDGVGRRVLAGASPLRMIGVRLPDSLPDTYMPRTSADVLVTTAGGTDVRVLNEHLSGTSSGIGGSPNSTRSQEDQLGPVADSVAAWAGPTLLLGDFNVTSGTQFHEFERRLLEGVGLHDTFDEAGVAATDLELRTFPAVRPDHNIDRAYASREFTATSVRALQDEVARRGSDHVPVLVEARIR